MNSYKHCKILSFQSRTKYVFFEILDLKSLKSLFSVILFFQYSEHFVLLGKWITDHSQMQTNDVTKDSPIDEYMK